MKMTEKQHFLLSPRARARFGAIVPAKARVNHESATLTFSANLADMGKRGLRGVNP